MKEPKHVRTDMNCTNCSKNFVAELDLSLDGNHVIECPHCGHEHCRVVTKGKVTDDRWDSRRQRVNVSKRNVWKGDSQPIFTSTASAFIRQNWLDRLAKK